MKRLILFALAVLIAGNALAANTLGIMEDGKILPQYLPTVSLVQDGDPAEPFAGQLWWNNSTNQLKVAGALGVYEFNATSMVAWDTAPTAFTFTDVTGADTSTVYTSDVITVAGINWPAPISVSGDATAKYSINNATAVSTNGTVELGDEVRAVVTSSASDGTAVNATVTIGGVSDAYSVTTAVGESASVEVSDDFSSDTTSNYVSGLSTLFAVSGGKAQNTKTYGRSYAYHSTGLSSQSHYVAGTVYKSGSSTSGLLFRCSGNTTSSTSYIITPDGAADRLALMSVNGSATNVLITSFLSGLGYFENGDYAKIKAVISQDNKVTVSVDADSDGEYEVTSNQYSLSNPLEGSYIGLYFSHNGASITVDDFSGGAN